MRHVRNASNDAGLCALYKSVRTTRSSIRSCAIRPVPLCQALLGLDTPKTRCPMPRRCGSTANSCHRPASSIGLVQRIIDGYLKSPGLTRRWVARSSMLRLSQCSHSTQSSWQTMSRSNGVMTLPENLGRLIASQASTKGQVMRFWTNEDYGKSQLCATRMRRHHRPSAQADTKRYRAGRMRW